MRIETANVAPLDNGTHPALLTLANGFNEPARLPYFGREPMQLSGLSEAEIHERDRCEAIINQGWDTFLEVGQALTTIRNKRLYRECHETFEEYCRRKWEFSKSHANRLIEAAVVVSILTPIGVKPKSESQLRPLVGLPPQRIPQAWQKAVELASKGQVTAKVVRLAAQEFKSSPALEPNRAATKKARSTEARPEVAKLLDKAEKAANGGETETLLKTLASLRKRLLS